MSIKEIVKNNFSLTFRVRMPTKGHLFEPDPITKLCQCDLYKAVTVDTLRKQEKVRREFKNFPMQICDISHDQKKIK